MGEVESKQSTNESKYQAEQYKKVYRNSYKPVIYFVGDYLYVGGFIVVCVFVTTDYVLQSSLLVGMCSLMLLMTFYFYISVGVSKMYALLRII